jgi:hypothetical protein
MSNTIKLKRSNVANAVPASGNLEPGELAINYTDGNLFYKNNANTVTVIASNQFVSVYGNITGNLFIGNGSQLSNINGNLLTVSNWSAGNVITNSIPNIGALRFNNSSGISVSDLGNNEALVTLGSSFKTWEVAGQANLVAVGEDVVEFVAGNGIVITTNAISYPQQIKFTSDGSANAALIYGNILSANITNVGVLSNLSVSGNITGANLISSTTYSAIGNVYGGNIVSNGFTYANGASIIT